MCVCRFARRLVRDGGVVVGLDRVLVGLGGVDMGFLVIALDVVLGSQMMMLGCFFVVLGGFVVCFVCHFDCPVGNLPARSYSPVGEIVVACSRRFTWFAGNSRSTKKAPHFEWEAFSFRAC
jgi:hypothetical protein